MVNKSEPVVYLNESEWFSLFLEIIKRVTSCESLYCSFGLWLIVKLNFSNVSTNKRREKKTSKLLYKLRNILKYVLVCVVVSGYIWIVRIRELSSLSIVVVHILNSKLVEILELQHKRGHNNLWVRDHFIRNSTSCERKACDNLKLIWF